MSEKEENLQAFSTYSKQDQYEKIMVYLALLQKSDQEFIGLYMLIEELGQDAFNQEDLIHLYRYLLDIVYDANVEAKNLLQQHLTTLQALQAKEAQLREKELQELELLEQNF